MSRAKGFQWENDFVQLAIARGYSAFRVHGQLPHDAMCSGLRVQCKDKEFDESGRVRIAKGQHKYGDNDWDVLALRFRKTLFLIPRHVLRMPGGTMKTVIRPVEFGNFIDAWCVFDGHEFHEDERMLFSIH